MRTRVHVIVPILASSLVAMITPPVMGAPLSQCGEASWYDRHGSPTAFGGVIDANAMTAAHRSLLQGTRVRVENMLNGRAVIVEIVDRGPFTRGRVIDVSRAAAEQLGFKARGVTRVRITSIGVSEASAACR
jgi:rare lipoprotein A